MDGCTREMKPKVGNVDARLKINGMGWPVVACLFADEDDTYLQRVKRNFRDRWINFFIVFFCSYIERVLAKGKQI